MDYYQQTRKQWSRYFARNFDVGSQIFEYCLVIPDFLHLILSFLLNEQIKGHLKILLILTIFYVINPIDVIPESIFGPFGLLDDIALIAYVFRFIFIQKYFGTSKKNWAGRTGVFHTIKKMMRMTDETIGSGLIKKIVDRF